MFSPICACSTGYRPSDMCRVPWFPILGLLLGLCLLAVIAALLLRLRRRWAAVTLASTLNERLLEARTQEVQQLQRVWAIDMADVRLVAKLDEGAFGEVWRGTFDGKDVAVKILRASIAEVDEEVCAHRFACISITPADFLPVF
jgi:hypothetical protein